MLFPMPSDYTLLLQASLLHHATRNPAISGQLAALPRPISISRSLQNIKAAHEEEELARFCTSTHSTQSPTVASEGLVSTAAAFPVVYSKFPRLLRAVVLELNSLPHSCRITRQTF